MATDKQVEMRRRNSRIDQPNNDQSATAPYITIDIERNQGPKIEKVSEILRKNKDNEDSFRPLLMAFGPFHHHGKHGEQQLNYKRGEELKIQLVQRFYKDEPTASSYQPDYEKVVAVTSEARMCYYEDSTKDINDADFAKMMFFDGCAILQFMGSYVTEEWYGVNIKDHEKAHIVHDLFLLENQLPFIVLKKLGPKEWIDEMFERFMKKIRPAVDEVKRSWAARITHLLYKYCNHAGRAQKNKENKQKRMKTDDDQDHKEPLHLLHRLWKYYVQESEYQAELDKKTKYKDWYSFRSAKELKTAGIKFSPSKTAHFTNVKYESFTPCQVLRLPTMLVNDSTKSLLLNLASYEMSTASPITIYPVSSYICLMASLLDQEEDVAELRRSVIILNRLRSDKEVVNLFKDAAQDLVSDRKAFGDVKMRIENHYSNEIKIKIMEWIHIHFRIMTFVPAIFGLAVTLLQTYAKIMQKK